MNNFSWGSGRQPIQLIGIDAPFQPRLQFGREYVSDPAKRAATFRQSHDASPTPHRNTTGGSIKQPAPQREQTIFGHRLTPNLQRQLRSGFSAPQNNGRLPGNHYPQIDHVKAAETFHSQRTNYRVTTVPTINGRMALRAVTSSD